MIQTLQQHTTKQTWYSPKDEPIVLCAADDHYVKPLAVTLRSAATSLKDGSHLHVVLLDGGISEASFTALEQTLEWLPITVLLPEEIEKVIYLDSDVLVADDLTELWELDLEGQYCLAAPDIACPYIDAYAACENDPSIKSAVPYFAVARRIDRPKTSGLPARQRPTCLVLGPIRFKRSVRRTVGPDAVAVEPRSTHLSLPGRGQQPFGRTRVSTASGRPGGNPLYDGIQTLEVPPVSPVARSFF